LRRYKEDIEEEQNVHLARTFKGSNRPTRLQ
jgi:hypothetical protein